MRDTNASPSKRSVKRLRKKNSLDADPSLYQTIALKLILFIFIVYVYGLISSIVNLPDTDNKGVLYNVRKGINILSNDGRPENDTALVPNNGDYDQEVVDRFEIPVAVWPVPRTNQQKDQWVTLPHPGDEAMTVTLPPFWSSPIHNNELMSREKAMAIGTCVEADASGNYQRGDKCPVHQRTIFVAIASYRDWQCKHTVTSIFDRAKHPERIRVAVVDQIVHVDEICDEPIHETCDALPE